MWLESILVWSSLIQKLLENLQIFPAFHAWLVWLFMHTENDGNTWLYIICILYSNCSYIPVHDIYSYSQF